MYFYCKEHAFTLVELVVTIAILAIIATLAVPSYLNFRARQELSNVTAMIHQLTQAAKSNAVTYHSIIVICSSTDRIKCTDNKWNTGAIMFSDLNNNENVDSNEIIHTALDTNLRYGSLRWNGGFASNTEITFQSDTGLPRGASGSFSYCSQHDSSLDRKFVLSKMGHIRIENQPC